MSRVEGRRRWTRWNSRNSSILLRREDRLGVVRWSPTNNASGSGAARCADTRGGDQGAFSLLNLNSFDILRRGQGGATISKAKKKPKRIIRVCLGCKVANSSGVKGCQSCGIELVEKCPECDEPFTGVSTRRKVKYCPHCLKEMKKEFMIPPGTLLASILEKAKKKQGRLRVVRWSPTYHHAPHNSWFFKEGIIIQSSFSGSIPVSSTKIF